MRASHRFLSALAAALLLIAGSRASAVTRQWAAFNGNWSSPFNWAPSGVPGNGDDVYLMNFDGVSRTITYDYSGFPVVLNSLNIGLLGGAAGATETLQMNNNTLNSSVEFVGTSGGAGNGSGTFNQSTGSNLVGGGGLYLGHNATDNGFYNLSGNGTLSSSFHEFLAYGNSSTAIFTQSGGANTLASDLSLELAVGSGSTATYALSGGTLTNTGTEIVGYLGAGTFNQSGGTNTINSNGAANGVLYLGFGGVSTGSYVLSGTGSLSVSGIEYVGYNGSGNFNQTNGSNSVSGLYLGYNGSVTGAYTLGGGSLLVGTGSEYVGYSGTGTFSQTGGTHQTTGGGFISIAYNSGSVGDYSFGGGSLTLSGDETVGYGGTGTFEQSGGTHTLNGTILWIGRNSGASGTYTMTGGTLTINPSALAGIIVGFSGSGTFNENGGTVTINGANSALYLGYNSSSTGNYMLGGNGSLSVTSQEYVGYNGTGSFTQNSGTHTISNSLNLGYFAGASGSFTLNGGSLSTGNVELVGRSGMGTFLQTGGTNTLTNFLTIGSNPSSSSSYTLVSGSLSAGAEYVGSLGAGTFTQSGGTNTITITSGIQSLLDVGAGPGSTGNFSLSGGMLSVNGNEFVGDSGTGVFNQTGGTNEIAGSHSLTIGNNNGSSGTYTLSGGSLAVGGLVNLGLLNGSTGVLTVTGSGALTTGNGIFVLGAPGNALSLNGGTITTPGLFLNGVPFYWTAGTLNLTSSVIFDSAAAANTTSAAFGSSRVLGSGQTLIISGDETLGGAGPFSLEIGAGSSHSVSGSLTISATGTLTLDAGGNLAFSSFIQNGGTFNGKIETGAPLTFNGGVLNGQLISHGVANFSTNFTVSGGMVIDGTIAIAGSHTTLTVNGSGLDSFAALTLAAGQTIAATNFINDVGGFVSSSGTIAAPFTNLGTFTENATSGTMLVTGFMVNYGYVGPITTGVGLRPTGGLDNVGTIQLNGGSVSGSGSVINDFGGLIQSGVGSSVGVVVSGVSAPLTNSGGVIVASSNTILNLTSFAGGNVNGGEIRVQNSATLTSQFAFPSSGTILLQGAAATLAGGAPANTGAISGLGRVTNVTDNDGVIQAIGGTLTLAAAGNTNDPANGADSGGQIQVGTGCTVIFSQGLAANAGTIALAGGTFDNNNRPITNASTGFIIGAGTFKSGGLTNNGIVRFADNPTSVYGSVTTAMPGSLVDLINNSTTFFSPVTIASDSSLTTENATARFLATLSGSVTSQLANSGTIEMAGASSVYGKVANQGLVSVHAGGNATFYGPFAGAGSVFNSGALTFNSTSTTNNIGGPLTNNATAKLTVTGGGALEIDAAPTLADASSILVTGGSRLKFNVQTGSATIGSAVTATVAATATLELAGSISALSSGSQRVNITNNSIASGLLVSGTNQQVGFIAGSGTTQVNAGSDLTANHIIQSALVIGGTAGSFGTVTIAASDASGNPLGQLSGSVLANSLTPTGQFRAGAASSANLGDGDGTDLAVPASGDSVGIGNGSPVPEPPARALALLAVLGVVSIQFARHHFRCQTL
jgi:fibronectin-binding autotransporter adhesin